jgi:hypothetical protein
MIFDVDHQNGLKSNKIGIILEDFGLNKNLNFYNLTDGSSRVNTKM